MLARFARLLLVRYAGGAGRAAAYLAAFNYARRVLRREPLVEVQRLNPGDRYVIEHLDISHKQQIKQLKREEKQARRARRAASKAGRRTAS